MYKLFCLYTIVHQLSIMVCLCVLLTYVNVMLVRLTCK